MLEPFLAGCCTQLKNGRLTCLCPVSAERNTILEVVVIIEVVVLVVLVVTVTLVGEQRSCISTAACFSSAEHGYTLFLLLFHEFFRFSFSTRWHSKLCEQMNEFLFLLLSFSMFLFMVHAAAAGECAYIVCMILLKNPSNSQTRSRSPASIKNINVDRRC